MISVRSVQRFQIITNISTKPPDWSGQAYGRNMTSAPNYVQLHLVQRPPGDSHGNMSVERLEVVMNHVHARALTSDVRGWDTWIDFHFALATSRCWQHRGGGRSLKCCPGSKRLSASITSSRHGPTSSRWLPSRQMASRSSCMVWQTARTDAQRDAHVSRGSLRHRPISTAHFYATHPRGIRSMIRLCMFE
jgi:hypothetical protein